MFRQRHFQALFNARIRHYCLSWKILNSYC